MSNHLNSSLVRRAARALALTPAVLLLGAAGSAVASPPEQWGPHPPVSALHALLVLVVIPGALFAVIWLLAYLPSMIRGQKYQPGLAWRSEPEWFGGPREGVRAADEVDPTAVTAGEDRGGASGRW